MSSPSPSEPRFSVVVVTYNSRETIPACLDAFRRAFAAQPESAEFLVVDNASRDGTEAWLQSQPEVGGRIRVMGNRENLGFSQACNQGARRARGEYVLFLNPDALLTSGAAERMAQAFADPKIGAVGPLSNYVAGDQRLDLHWPASGPTLEQLPGNTAAEKSEAIARTLRDAQPGSVRETKLLIGFCLMLPRLLLRALGGMDENLFLGNDDLELSWRLRLKGFRLAVARDAFVFHAGQKSFATDPKATTDRLVQESTDALFRKLSLHFGGDEKIPSPQELWGITWFKPSAEAYWNYSPNRNDSPQAPVSKDGPHGEVPMPNGMFLQYPETLRPHLLAADRVGFLGTVVAALPTEGPIHGVDLRGRKIPLSDQDLLIARISPDLVDDLPQRLRNVRRRLPQLQQLCAILNSRQALGKPAHPRGFEVPIDVTSAGVTAALRLAGFHVSSVLPYSGCPDLPDPEGPRTGWWQIDAEPRPKAHRTDALVSIIILGFNQVEYTRQCVESIQRHTRQRHEFILIDNGSKDGTWDYFQSVPNAVAIRNETNRGVAAGWNQGLRAAKGEYLLILNNDTLLFPDTLENMVRLCESDAAIGLVGPRCNRVAAAQAVEGTNYRTLPEMEAFAKGWQGDHDLGSAEYDWVKGVCTLMPRRAFEKIGFYDERYGKGNFEDDDYCLRARYHGFKTCIAHDSYLHHYGSVSFGQENVDWNALMLENQRKFAVKWQRGAEALHDVQVGASGADQISAWMAEGTQAYAAGHLDQARAAFLKVVDADPKHAQALSALGVLAFHAERYRDAVLLSMQSLLHDNPDRDTGLNVLEALTALNGAVSQNDVEALRRRFPSNPAFQPVPDSPIPDFDASWTPVSAHAWREEVESRIESGEYTQALNRIGEILSPENPKTGMDNASCHNFMGVIAHLCGRPDEALGYFTRALEFQPTWNDALLNAFDSALASRKREALLPLIDNALRLEPRHTQALRMRRHLEREGDSIYAAKSFDALEEGAALLERAEAEMKEGRPHQALRVFLDAVDQRPDNPQALNGLGIIAFSQNRFDDSFQLFGEAARLHPGDQDILLNLWESARAMRRENEVRPALEASLHRNPGFGDVRQILNAG